MDFHQRRSLLDEASNPYEGDSYKMYRLCRQSGEGSTGLSHYVVCAMAVSHGEEAAKGGPGYRRAGGASDTMSQMPRATKRLYSIEEAAQYLGRSEWGIRRLIWKGKLPQVKCDKRVHLDIQDMDRFIETNKMID